jgi:hypothetical protein
MTFSLPNSSDDIFTKGWLYKHMEEGKVVETNLNTLWSAIEQSTECKVFRNIAIKALTYDDLNNPYGIYKTIFIPIDVDELPPLIERDLFDMFTINTQLTLYPCDIPTNIKVQNNLKEYIPISIRPIDEGGDIYVNIFNKVWKVLVRNIQCINGIIHIVKAVQD